MLLRGLMRVVVMAPAVTPEHRRHQPDAERRHEHAAHDQRRHAARPADEADHRLDADDAVRRLGRGRAEGLSLGRWSAAASP